MNNRKDKNEGNGRKINVWSTNKFSKELQTAVSVVFSVPSSVQSKSKMEVFLRLYKHLFILISYWSIALLLPLAVGFTVKL